MILPDGKVQLPLFCLEQEAPSPPDGDGDNVTGPGCVGDQLSRGDGATTTRLHPHRPPGQPQPDTTLHPANHCKRGVHFRGAQSSHITVDVQSHGAH